MLQGGGIRCFWQAGFLTALARYGHQPPERILAVSAGAAIAAAFAAGTLEQGFEAFKQATAQNAKNIYLSHLFGTSGKRLCPHDDMYRGCLMQMLDAAAMARLQRGPRVEILISRPPAGLGTVAALTAGLAVALCRHFAHAWALKLARFTAELVPLASCPDAAQVADLVLASSCTPPVTALSRYRGRLALDGCLMQSIPLPPAESPPRPTLALLTMPVPRRLAGLDGAVVYVGPSRPLDAPVWEYTRPDLIESYYRLGEEDAGNWLRGPAAQQALALSSS